MSFAPASAAGREVAGIDLAALQDPAGDPGLLEIARTWGERLGVPLRLEGLTSGRELLLTVDQEALAAVVAERLTQRDGVGAEVIAEPRGGGPRLAVAFEPDSAFAAAVSGAASVVLGPESSPVVARVEEAGPASAILAIDTETLITAMLARLQADPDIRYVQRNQLLRRYGEKPRV